MRPTTSGYTSATAVHGGEVVAAVIPTDIMKCKKSITGAYLSGRMKIPVPSERRRPTGFLTIKGARENNLKNIDVQVPLGIMTCITGFAYFEPVAENIKIAPLSAYDQGCVELIQNSFSDYLQGKVDYDKAKKNFETAIKERYPDIEKVTWPK